MTVRGIAAHLDVTRSTAGGTLRALERAGFLDARLVGGGRLGYTVTAAGRRWLDDIADR